MKCPRCSAVLKVDHYENVEVDVCATCGGVWLDQKELQPILETISEVFCERLISETDTRPGVQISTAEIQSVEPCPKCSQPMLAMNWGGNSGVVLDRCLEHGLWFDRGELEKIQILHEKWSVKIKDPEMAAKVQHLLQREQSALNSALRENSRRAARYSMLGSLLNWLGIDLTG